MGSRTAVVIGVALALGAGVVVIGVIVRTWGSSSRQRGPALASSRADGYVIRVVSVDTSDAVDASEEDEDAGAQMTIHLEIDAPDRESGARLAGVHWPLKVVDDRGEQVAALHGDFTVSVPSRGPARYVLTTAVPDEGARSLSISGELRLYEQVEVRHSISASEPSRRLPFTIGGIPIPTGGVVDPSQEG